MKVKYPRTYHLPFSEGKTDDDKTLSDTSQFDGKRVIVGEKMDGENFTGYRDGYTHARSLDSTHKSYRDWSKKFWCERAWKLPLNYRLCAEDMFAQHSIVYDNLDSYLYGISVWDETNTCLSWDETMEWFEELEIVVPTIFYDGIWDEDKIKEIVNNLDLENQEGIVVRVADSFHYDDFSKNVAKWVRKDHVQTDEHWMNSEIKPNKLKV